MKKPFVFVLLLLLASVGCSGNISLHGKVHFSDGAPLDTGIVCFQSDKGTVSRAPLQADGTFKVTTVKKNDGIVPGTYKVFIAGAMRGEAIPGAKASADGGIPEGNVFPLIDPKLMHPDTSGLTCEVKSGMKLPYLIQVSAPMP